MNKANENNSGKKHELLEVSIWKKIVFSLLITIAILLLLELTAGYLINRPPGAKLTQRDKDLLFTLKPDTRVRMQIGSLDQAEWTDKAPWVEIYINKDGYRGPIVKKDKKSDELRIICMGDSITFGLDVDQNKTYPAQLRRSLQKAYPDKTISVINAASPGYTSRQGLFILQSKFLKYHPDIVIWGFGFNDSSQLGFVSRADAELISVEPGKGSKPLDKQILFWLFDRSVFQLMYNTLILGLWGQEVGLLAEKLQNTNTESLKSLSAVVHSAEFYSNCRVPPEDFKINLLVAQSLAERNNFKLIVVNFFGTQPLYSRISAEFCRNNGIPYLNFSELFQRYFSRRQLPEVPEYQQMFKKYRQAIVAGALEKNSMLYLTTDNLHPNDIGHHMIGTVIARFISREMKVNLR